MRRYEENKIHESTFAKLASDLLYYKQPLNPLITTTGEKLRCECFTNIQLAFWKDAKDKYFKLVSESDNPDLADMVLIVVALLNSLTFLLGRNDETKEGQTVPEIPNMLNTWGIKERPDLKRDFKPMFEFYRNILKHPDSHKIHNDIVKLDEQKLREFMKTTQKIWLWFMQKYYAQHNNGVIPDEQKKEFQEVF